MNRDRVQRLAQEAIKRLPALEQRACENIPSEFLQIYANLIMREILMAASAHTLAGTSPREIIENISFIFKENAALAELDA